MNTKTQDYSALLHHLDRLSSDLEDIQCEFISALGTDRLEAVRVKYYSYLSTSWRILGDLLRDANKTSTGRLRTPTGPAQQLLMDI